MNLKRLTLTLLLLSLLVGLAASCTSVPFAPTGALITERFDTKVEFPALTPQPGDDKTIPVSIGSMRKAIQSDRNLEILTDRYVADATTANQIIEKHNELARWIGWEQYRLLAAFLAGAVTAGGAIYIGGQF